MSADASGFAQFKGSFLFHLNLVSDLCDLALNGMQHSLVYLIHVSQSKRLASSPHATPLYQYRAATNSPHVCNVLQGDVPPSCNRVSFYSTSCIATTGSACNVWSW